MTPRNRTPEQPKVTASAATEALAGLLANRAGWESTDAGWTHPDKGISIEARGGTSAFRASRGEREMLFTTRAGLELFLAGAGA